MKQKILVTAMSLITSVAAFNVVAGGAEETSKGTDAYVTDMTGQVVLDSSSHCVRTIMWKPEAYLANCDSEPKVAKTADVKPSIAVVENAAPAIKDDPRYVLVSLQAGALFDVDKTELKTRGKEKLDILARKLKETITTETIEIAGHTDSTGSDTYNQRLSERRAEAVKAYLTLRGIPGDKVQALGFGESKPIAKNTTAEGRSQNRRVEVKIRATKQLN